LLIVNTTNVLLVKPTESVPDVKENSLPKEKDVLENVQEDITKPKMTVEDVTLEIVLNVLDITNVQDVTKNPSTKTEIVLEIVEEAGPKEVENVIKNQVKRKRKPEKIKLKMTKKKESKEIITENNLKTGYIFPEPSSYLTLLDL